MSDQEINIAIAEACGWTNVAHNTVFSGRKIGRGIFGNSPSGGEYRLTPNYCNDLNAMHEVEKTLSEEQWENYNFILCNLVGGYSKTNKEAIHASSRQKAEAFLETIKK